MAHCGSSSPPRAAGWPRRCSRSSTSSPQRWRCTISSRSANAPDPCGGCKHPVSGVFLPLVLIIAAVAAILSYLGIAAMIGWLRARALAKPNHRSSHTAPTPQGAGIVIVPAALLTCGVALAVSGAPWPGSAPYAMLVAVAALALTALGFADDTRSLSVAPRLAAQFLAVAGAIALMPSWLRILPESFPLVLERMLTVGAALWFVNLFNFMDGIDLISATETVAITLGIVLLAALGLVPPAYAILAAALGGAVAGFVPWNTPPARLFLGDAGSIPIGFLLAVLLVHVAGSGLAAAALILPLYYVADATITLMRRLARGERVWQAHREHFYQQATRNGSSVI